MPAYILPQAFIFIRVSITVTLFWIVGHFWGNQKVEKKDFFLLIACAFFGVVINQELFFAGLNITTPINGALLMIVTPIIVMVVAFIRGMEKLTGQKILGLLMGTAGAVIIVSGKGLSFSSKTIVGDLLILLNATSYAIYLVAVRPLMKKYHPMTVIKWVFLFGLLPVVFLGWNQFSDISWHRFAISTWWAVFFVVFCTTFCAYLFNVIALREVHSSTVGAYIYLQPILATIISVFVGKDEVTVEKIISGVFIFSGVFLVSFTNPQKETIAEAIYFEE